MEQAGHLHGPSRAHSALTVVLGGRQVATVVLDWTDAAFILSDGAAAEVQRYMKPAAGADFWRAPLRTMLRAPTRIGLTVRRAWAGLRAFVGPVRSVGLTGMSCFGIAGLGLCHNFLGRAAQFCTSTCSQVGARFVWLLTGTHGRALKCLTRPPSSACLCQAALRALSFCQLGCCMKHARVSQSPSAPSDIGPH